jgi:hypothetical protein
LLINNVAKNLTILNVGYVISFTPFPCLERALAGYKLPTKQNCPSVQECRNLGEKVRVNMAKYYIYIFKM